MSIRDRILSGGIWAIIGKLGTGIAQLIIGIILARLLTPEDFGSFQIIQRIVLFGAILGSIGMPFVIVRLVAEGIAKKNSFQSYIAAKKIFQMIFICSLIIVLAYFLMANRFINPTFKLYNNDLMPMISLLIFLATFQRIIPECFRGLHDIKMASIFSGAATNSIFVILILFGWNFLKEINLSISIFCLLASSLMAFKVSSIFLIKKLKKLKKGICAPTIKHFDIIKIATPLYISTLMQFFANQADIWIIAAFASVSEVAYYGAAARLVLLLTVPWMVANAVIQPIIAELWTKDQFKKLEKLLQTVANITFVLGIIPTLIFVFWGSHIMGHLFGEYYRNGSMVLCILSIGQIANLAACPSGVMLIMGGKQKGLMTITIISALSFLSISFFGIFKYGPLAVATAATFSAFIRQLLMAYYCKKTLNIKTYIGKNW